MNESIEKSIRKVYNKFIHSVAFFPAIMGVVFLLLAILSLQLDENGLGDTMNEEISWLTLQDPATARTIVATVAAGIISLAVFSFSMFMIVMNQAASQMSNRMLDNLINLKFQKIVLGFYIGSLVYALVLLSNISEKEADQMPTFSVYLLILLMIINIFLFVYFLHHITNSFRYEQLIQRIHNRTMGSLDFYLKSGKSENMNIDGVAYGAIETGYFQGFAKDKLVRFAQMHDIAIEFLHNEGEYVLKGTPFIRIQNREKINDDLLKKLFLNIDFYYGQEVDKNPYYGYLHLMEVGVKALSPGINDPGTAVLCLHSLTDLLTHLMQNPIPNCFSDNRGTVRVITKEMGFEEVFNRSVMRIWEYGANDSDIQRAMLRMIHQLKIIDNDQKYYELLDNVASDVQSKLNTSRNERNKDL